MTERDSLVARLTPEALGRAAYAFDASNPDLGTYVRLQLALEAALSGEPPQPEAPTATPVCKTCGGSKFVEVTYPEGYQPGFDDVGRVNPCPTCYAPFLRKGSVAEQPVTPQPVADAGDVADITNTLMDMRTPLAVSAANKLREQQSALLSQSEQIASLIKERARITADLLEDFREEAAGDGSKSFSTATVQLLIAKIDHQSEQIASLTKERARWQAWHDQQRDRADGFAKECNKLRSRLAELEQEAVKAVEIAEAFAHSEELEALAGMAASTGVHSPGWLKDALHSHGQEVALKIAAKLKGSAS